MRRELTISQLTSKVKFILFPYICTYFLMQCCIESWNFLEMEVYDLFTRKTIYLDILRLNLKFHHCV